MPTCHASPYWMFLRKKTDRVQLAESRKQAGRFLDSLEKSSKRFAALAAVKS